MSEYLQQVQRGVDFIEERLDETFELRAVSRAAGMSHAHFQRTFRALTGDTLATYVRLRRMANALDLLLHSDRRVLDIAVAAGFESQEAFARAFKRIFGMTPMEYRKIGDKHRFLKKVRLDAGYLEHLSGMHREPELVEREPMTVLGLRTRFYGRESEKNNLGEVLPTLWDRFMERAQDVPRPVPGDYYGVVAQDDDDPERLVYYACRATGAVGGFPDGMDSTVVPGGTYAVFEHRGKAIDVDQTVNYIYGTWLATSDYRHTCTPDLEIYDHRWHPTSATSVMLYAVPVARR